MTKLVHLFMDEEGLLKPNHHFLIEKNRYTGKVIIAGMDVDDEGDSTYLDLPSSVTPTLMLEHVIWVGDDKAMEKQIKAGRIERPDTRAGVMGGPMETIWEWKPNV